MAWVTKGQILYLTEADWPTPKGVSHHESAGPVRV